MWLWGTAGFISLACAHFLARSAEKSDANAKELSMMPLMRLGELLRSSEGEEIEGSTAHFRSALQSGESRRVLLKGCLQAFGNRPLLNSPMTAKPVLGFESKVVRVIEQKVVEERTRSRSRSPSNSRTESGDSSGKSRRERTRETTKRTRWERKEHSVLDQSTSIPVALNDGTGSARLLDNCRVMKLSQSAYKTWMPMEDASKDNGGRGSGLALDLSGGLHFRMGNVDLSLDAHSGNDRRTIGLRAEESVLDVGTEVIFVGDARVDIDGSLVLSQPSDVPLFFQMLVLHIRVVFVNIGQLRAHY
ncbi:MAG: hypothetical protein MHM6MM_000629 [Cercozoa sp. M6MM]